MAQRDDLDIFFTVSPRVLRVLKPSQELIVQDMHDTARDIEDEPFNLIYPNVIQTVGKEPLGGGVTVGLTATLQNMLIAFDPRTISVVQGTATSPSSNGLTLIDTAATYITDGVEPGASIINFDDQSVGTVARVISETELRLFPINRGDLRSLDDGITNTWTIGDYYKIWNIEQMILGGGNTVAVDENGSSIRAILPTFGTQIIQTNSSSATLQELESIQHSSFDGGVTVDLTLSTSGVSFPLGTPQAPVGTFVDALLIAVERGFTTLFIIGNATINSGLDFTNIRFVGESQTKTLLTITPAAIVVNSEFEEATIQGTLDGGSTVNACRVIDLNYVDGFISNCVLSGVITLSGASSAHLLNCWSGVPDVPIIDCASIGSDLALRNYNGEIIIRNKANGDTVQIDLNSGRITLEPTVTAGLITVRGIGNLVDNSTGTAVVDSIDLIRGETLARIERLGEVNRFLIEAASRASHQSTGESFYMDPINGDDANDGMLPSTPKLTFAVTQALATPLRRDVIWVLNTSTHVVEIDEVIEITVGHLQVRAPGHNVHFSPQSDYGFATVRVNAHGVGIEGFTIEGFAGSGQDGIVVGSYERFQLLNTIITDVDGDGLVFQGGTGNLIPDDHDIINVNIHSVGGNAVTITDCRDSFFRQCKFQNNRGWGIELIATQEFIDPETSNTFGSTHAIEIDDSVIHHNQLGGVLIGGTPFQVSQTIIRANMFIHSFNSPLVQDDGRQTHDDRASESFQSIEDSLTLVATDVTTIRDINYNRLEVDIAGQRLVLYDDAGTTIVQTWALATNGGELVTTATGVQTKRGVPQL